MSSRVIMSGAGVPAHALRVLALVSPVRGGGPLGSQFEIPVGTIDRQAGLWILGMASGEVIYIMNAEMRAAPVGQFLQGYFIGQVASEVYRRTAWIIPASQVVMAFSMGVVIGYFGAVGVAANIVVVAARLTLFLQSHPNEVQIVREILPVASRELTWFREHCPVTYGKMMAVVRRGLWEAVLSSPGGVTAQDVAGILGRLLGGIAGAPDAGLRALALVMSRTVAVYSAIHLPPAAARGAAQHGRQIADALAEELRRQGAAITPADGEAMRAELLAAGLAAPAHLEELRSALERISPALDRLVADYRRD